MKTYNVILAYDVPCYRTIQVAASDAESAERIAQAKLQHMDSSEFEPAWDLADDYRVADVIEATGVKS